jgi:3'-5' exoribonuclease
VHRKQQFVQQIQAGDVVEDIFLASEKTILQKRDGSPYLRLTLGDKTGEVKAVMWDHVNEAIPHFSSGDFVQIRGAASEYQGLLQITVKSLSKCPEGDVDAAAFLPSTDKNVPSMLDRLQNLTRSVQKGWLQELLEEFWKDAEFVRGFITAPAAKRMHHAYLGGLLEHTLSVAVLAEKTAAHYAGIRRDLLLAGAVLHDIGKIHELDYRTGIDYTTEGRLLSHIVIGLRMLDEKLGHIGSVPEEEVMLLRHLIVSHHGKKEFGSPEEPRTLEALLLNYVDEMDSKIAAVREAIAVSGPGEAWTPYHRMMERHFYIGDKMEG